MEMPPDTLEADGVNEVFVVVTLDESFITEKVSVRLFRYPPDQKFKLKY